MMDFDLQLKKYADVLVRVGVNISQGDDLVVMPSVTDDPATRKLVHYVVAAAYDAGARIVDVQWHDEQLAKIRLEHADAETLGDVPQWQYDMIEQYVNAGAARLAIRGENPALLAGLDRDKIRTMQRAAQEAAKPFRDKMIDDNVWSYGAVPVQAWADRVFPDAPEADRVPKLWQAIFDATRVTRDDPVTAWRQHRDALIARRDYLNRKQYTALKFTAPGTDLTIGLPQGHIWAGASSTSADGTEFIPNIPTEELFTMPHKARVNGTVRATKPLSYSGTIIENFTFTFKDGKVVDYSAEAGSDAIQQLLTTDENASYLGEVALVPENSPISRTGILFYNTLFDENAASHIALGRAYKMTLEQGVQLSDEDFEAAGGNISMAHTDFMIGSDDMHIDGITSDGSAEPVMRDGEWAFEVEIGV